MISAVAFERIFSQSVSFGSVGSKTRSDVLIRATEGSESFAFLCSTKYGNGVRLAILQYFSLALASPA